MKERPLSRRSMFGFFARAAVGAWAVSVLRPVKAVAQKVAQSPVARSAREAIQKAFVTAQTPTGYDVHAHHWAMAIDVERCIGCGLCAEACKGENHVLKEPFYFRTWIERYIIRKPDPRSFELRGETLVDSPNGGIGGFPPSPVRKENILRTFFVPKLCNQCEHSPCIQACPVGATFDSPDGAVLIDKEYCIGCGFCVQACPYGCRFLNPVTKTAEKCTLCYHRITHGLRPACVEVCPTGARIFGDLKDGNEKNPVRVFIENNKVQVLKPHLGTEPRVYYAGLDKEVR
ncbi:MAG: 4Fe-4S dicluster domain-containing protein [Verrucomicrobiae bacterium]|nr:4Fe-4S dicluster domain-containing protein [Verrucomicrobiae bacterium]